MLLNKKKFLKLPLALSKCLLLVKVVSFLFFCAILLQSLVACHAFNFRSKREPQEFKEEFFGTFDTVVQLLVQTEDEADFKKYFAHTEKRFQELHKLFDRYHFYDGINNIASINKHAGEKAIKVEPAIIEMLNYYLQFSEQTKGKLRGTLGAVIDLWNEQRELATLKEGVLYGQAPADVSLSAVQGKIAASSLEINAEAQTVFLKEKGVLLDVGAIAKGYACELVAKELEAMGVKHAILNAGQSSTRLIGKPVERETWKIGLLDPYQAQGNNLFAIVAANNTSVVTTGDYQRYFIGPNQEIFHHIIDPDTLRPANLYKAVIVIYEDGVIADALSTSLFMLSIPEGEKLLMAYQGIECLWIDIEGKVSMTTGMKSYLTEPISENIKS